MVIHCRARRSSSRAALVSAPSFTRNAISMDEGPGIRRRIPGSGTRRLRTSQRAPAAGSGRSGNDAAEDHDRSRRTGRDTRQGCRSGSQPRQGCRRGRFQGEPGGVRLRPAANSGSPRWRQTNLRPGRAGASPAGGVKQDVCEAAKRRRIAVVEADRGGRVDGADTAI
jgi:hypothetical protein